MIEAGTPGMKRSTVQKRRARSLSKSPTRHIRSASGKIMLVRDVGKMRISPVKDIKNSEKIKGKDGEEGEASAASLLTASENLSALTIKRNVFDIFNYESSASETESEQQSESSKQSSTKKDAIPASRLAGSPSNSMQLQSPAKIKPAKGSVPDDSVALAQLFQYTQLACSTEIRTLHNLTKCPSHPPPWPFCSLVTLCLVSFPVRC